MMTGLMVTLLTKTEALQRLLIAEVDDEPAAAVSGDVASALAFELGREKFRTESQLRGLIDHLIEEGGKATPLALSLAEAADLRIPEISELRDLVGAVVNERASGAPLSRHLYDALQLVHLRTRPFKAVSAPISVKSVVMMSDAELSAECRRRGLPYLASEGNGRFISARVDTPGHAADASLLPRSQSYQQLAVLLDQVETGPLTITEVLARQDEALANLQPLVDAYAETLGVPPELLGGHLEPGEGYVVTQRSVLPPPTWRTEPDGRTLLDLARETDASLSAVERDIMDRIAEIPPAPPRPRRLPTSSAPAPSPASPPKAPRRRRR